MRIVIRETHLVAASPKLTGGVDETSRDGPPLSALTHTAGAQAVPLSSHALLGHLLVGWVTAVGALPRLIGEGLGGGGGGVVEIWLISQTKLTL